LTISQFARPTEKFNTISHPKPYLGEKGEMPSFPQLC
jgi:hypothetical protein